MVFLTTIQEPDFQLVRPAAGGQVGSVSLVGICLIAVGTMAWTVRRPSLGQAIRLNED